MKRLIKNSEVLYKGKLQKVDVLFDENKILKIQENINEECEVIDGTGLTLLPGLVDVHVHFRQPGFEEKETIKTGSLAAACGGFTTVIAMPNVKPSPDSVEVMKDYLDLVNKESIVHTLVYGTITKNEEGKELSDISNIRKLGVKCFSDDGTGLNNQDLLKQVLIKSKKEDFIVACHTENLNYRLPNASVHNSEVLTKKGWIGIPSECEYKPIELDLKSAIETGGKYHICHMSAQESVELLRWAKHKGGNVSGEVTSHHLLLEDKDVKGTLWKMNPPLRSHEDRMSLIKGLEEGTIDFIANDHAPHTLSDKNKSMAKAAFGIVSLETSLPLLYTEFVYRQKRWTLNQLVEWMSIKPAKRFGLLNIGLIEEGYNSDLVLVKLDEENIIDINNFKSKGKNTPFNGYSVNLVVKETIVSGKTVYKED